MATLPSATQTISETAGAPGAGTDLVCVWSPCATSDDAVPRLFGSAAAAYAQHGYCEGVEYAARHVQKTGKGFMFVGLPIAAVGVVGRVDKTGNTGTSVASVAAGGDGVLGSHDGEIVVESGGTIGTSQIRIKVSCDGGRSYKSVRLGTGNSYVIPFVGVTLSFAAGTLVTGDTVITWHGSAPRSDASGWASARAALAAQLKTFRSVVLCGALQNATEGNAFADEIDAYATENDRFIFARAEVPDRLPLAAMSRERVSMTGAPTITFLEVGGTGDTITRSAGSFVSDGFAVGDTITVAGAVATAGYNNVTGVIASLTATVITLGTTDLINEGPISGVTITATPTITFAEVGGTGDTITRNRGSWVADGFRAGDLVTVAGTASNNVTTDGVTTVTALVLTLNTTDLAAEVIGSYGLTIAAGQTQAVWAAAQDAAFETVNSFRLDLALGMARFTSPFSAWTIRRPASWFASVREYQHDLHVATWRKSDGDVDADLLDADGNLAEYDDRVDGAAASAGRFTSLRSWGNGPTGGFVSQSLTRGDDGSLLSLTHNVAVVNLAMSTTQYATENVIGRSLVLNANGTAATDALNTVQSEVNAALELALLQNRGEGPRASSAVWTPSADDILNVPEALLTGVLVLNLNGTIHSVATTVRISAGGQ